MLFFISALLYSSPYIPLYCFDSFTLWSSSDSVYAVKSLRYDAPLSRSTFLRSQFHYSPYLFLSHVEQQQKLPRFYVSYCCPISYFVILKSSRFSSSLLVRHTVITAELIVVANVHVSILHPVSHPPAWTASNVLMISFHPYCSGCRIRNKPLHGRLMQLYARIKRFSFNKNKSN